MPRTAVAAPPAEPFEDLFEVIDRMSLVELLTFTRRLYVRKFEPLPAGHPLLRRDGPGQHDCPACQRPFVEGDVTTLVMLGPGDDPRDRTLRDEGRPYNAVGVVVHWDCSTQAE